MTAPTSFKDKQAEWKASLTEEQRAELEKPYDEASAPPHNPFLNDHIKLDVESTNEAETPSLCIQCFSFICACLRSIFCCFCKAPEADEDPEASELEIDDKDAPVEADSDPVLFAHAAEEHPIPEMPFDHPIPVYSNEDQRKAGLLLTFYQGHGSCLGKGGMIEGLTQPQVNDYNSNGWLEKRHDYIQWLFPSPYPTEAGERKTSPRLDRAFVDAFQDSQEMQYNFDRALRMMMLFYGLQINFSTNTVRRFGNQEAISPRHNWLTKDNHNFRRLSRILTSMKYLNHRPELRIALYDMLCDIAAKEGKGIISYSTLGHWKRACHYLPRDLV